MNTANLCSVDFTDLIASTNAKRFPRLLRAYISQPGPLRNFGAFYWQSVNNDECVLSMWNGELSDYRLRSASQAVIDNPEVHQTLYNAVRTVEPGSREVSLFRPPKDDPRYKIMGGINVSERLAVISREKDRGLITFYLRSAKDGSITEDQFEQYNRILPVAHELISVRQKLIGCEVFHYSPGENISTMRERGLSPFIDLSERESQVCDAIIQGKTATGTALELDISVSTVNTLKRRAYSKLKVNSSTQLAALVINDHSK